MEHYRSTEVSAAQRLTQLYQDTKKSSRNAISYGSINDPPEIQSLNRKFRLQKDRLVAWGLEWSDSVEDGDIDRMVEQAGLTEVVESVMENIKDILDSIERVNAPTIPQPGHFPAEKGSIARVGSYKASDITRYEDLVKDMTSAIDLLCELKSRRSHHEGERSGKGADSKKGEGKDAYSSERPTTPVPAYPAPGNQYPSPSKQSFSGLGSSFLDSSQKTHIPKINPSLLMIPQEGPPAYGDSKITFRGASSSPRIFGLLRQSSSVGRSSFSQQSSAMIPVMIEYARYDRLYKDTDMVLPLSRLDRVYRVLQAWDASTSSTLTKPIGYFEDAEQPRIGLIFELPPQMQTLQQQAPEQALPEQPVTLSMLLHQIPKTPTASSTSNAPIIPPLENRFRLAQQLVSAFQFLHQHDFAHRNVSSSSVALLPKRDHPQRESYDFRRPLLCSVDLFSEFDVDPSPEMLHQNIYRHPDDPRITGPTASQEYDIRFDLYSLSLILLEIGMWHPLADLYKEKYSLKDFRTRVEKVWIRRLAGRCGTAYTRCVHELFQAGSKRQPSQEENHLMNVLNKAVARMQRCCLIDDEDEPDDEGFDIAESEAPTSTDMDSTILPEKEPLQAEPFTYTETEKKPLEQGVKGPCFLFPDLKIPTDILKMYESFESRAARIANKVLKGPRDSFWLALEYTGASQESAKPTICVGCSNPKLVRMALKKHLRYDPGVFELSVFRDCASRSKISRSNQDPAPQNPGFHERPICGASIGAWRYGEHSAAVSFGGVVLVDNKPFGMTVHHVLEPEEDDNGAPTTPSKAPVSGNDLDMSNLQIVDDSDDDGEDDDTMSLDDDDSFEEEDEEFDNDTPGVEAGEGRRIVVTQPALDDLEEDFFPCDEDRDDEHTLSHRLGHVYSSSGIRCWDKDGTRHEMDWLLFEVDENRLQPWNIVSGGRRHCREVIQKRPALKEPVCRQNYLAKEDLFPRQVVSSSELAGLDVHCFGRTCGLGEGRISEQMRWVRFSGRNNPAKVWSVRGTFGKGGDSGAWAVDNKTGRVCGHVLGWSSNFGIAYIAAMDVMFEDIRRTLHARSVMLPGDTSSATMTSASGTQQQQQQQQPVSSGSSSSALGTGTGTGNGAGAGPLVAGGGSPALTMENLRHHKHLLARHMLLTGNASHTEKEWSLRRARLGQMA